jgi:hypothetical protein
MNTGRRKSINVALWITALTITVILARGRFTVAAAQIPGVDFGYFLHAAQNVAVGQSPYTVQDYAYPPLLALMLAPFSQIGLQPLWHIWVGLMLFGLVGAVTIFLFTQASCISPWLKPILFAFCAFTVLFDRYYPVSRDLFLGQSDTIAFPVLVLSAYAASQREPLSRSLFIGMAGLLKAWPGSIGVSFFQRGLQYKKQLFLALGVTLAVAPVQAVMFWGKVGIVGFIKNALHVTTGNQSYINDSVLGATRLLFSHSGQAHPLIVSSALHIAVATILIAWILTLLVITLRTVGDPVLCTFHVTFCILLLMPVSHRQYAVYVLPILWIWAARTLQTKGTDKRALTVTALLLLWWANQTHLWPYGGSSVTISATHYCVPFFADMIAITLSVMAERKRVPAVD